MHKIHALIAKEEGVEKSDTQKFRDVLLFFFDYFCERENLSVLTRIQSYFVILDDFFNQDRMEGTILSLLEKNANVSVRSLVLKNLEYFFGKIMLSYLIDYKESSDNQYNLELLL